MFLHIIQEQCIFQMILSLKMFFFVPTFTSNLISISKFVNTQFRSVKLKIKVKKIDDLVT